MKVDRSLGQDSWRRFTRKQKKNYQNIPFKTQVKLLLYYDNQLMKKNIIEQILVCYESIIKKMQNTPQVLYRKDHFTN
jgi:uncharacterized protein YaaW (UPF0174 family)